MPGTSATIQLIQSILAPALMISGCGLLILALFNRYAIQHNRIRLLNDERRKIYKTVSRDEELPEADKIRINSLEFQINNLLNRARMLHNAILYIIISIIFFILSSLAIAVVLFLPKLIFAIFPLIVFLSGMVSLFIGVMITANEIRLSFTNIRVEVNTVVR
jgi:hypothetical protein